MLIRISGSLHREVTINVHARHAAPDGISQSVSDDVFDSLYREFHHLPGFMDRVCLLEVDSCVLMRAVACIG